MTVIAELTSPTPYLNPGAFCYIFFPVSWREVALVDTKFDPP